jgi:hypothetical protein
MIRTLLHSLLYFPLPRDRPDARPGQPSVNTAGESPPVAGASESERAR